MTTIDGRKIASDIIENLKFEVAALPFRPVFCDIVIGDDPVSLSYVHIKGRKAEEVGMSFMLKQYPDSIQTEELKAEIQRLNSIPDMCGIIVQLPLPGSINKDVVLNAIDPGLDVDCIGRVNNELFYRNQAPFPPPTAAAVLAILDSLPEPLEGKHFLVVGQGDLVGRPVSHLLRARRYKVDVADRSTGSLSRLLQSADVVISGTGQPKLIDGSYVREGVIIIDAGTAESGGGIVGDVDADLVSGRAAYLSPVPGGVGPVTVTMLLSNVASVAKQK